MACTITSGLPLQCRESMPGVQKVFITNFENVTGYTLNATNVITGMTLSPATTFYTFNLNKEAGEFLENGTSSPTNGTVAYEPTVNLYLSKYATTIRNQIQLLAKTKLGVIVLDRNNQYWYLGATNGMDATTLSGVVGKAYLSDPNGWNITLTGQEPVPAFEVSSTLIPSITT